MAENEKDGTDVVDDGNVNEQDEKNSEEKTGELSVEERLKKLEQENEDLRREKDLASREKSGLNKTITGLKEKIEAIEDEGKSETEKLVAQLQRENEELKAERDKSNSLTIERDAMKAFNEAGVPLSWLDIVKIGSVDEIEETIVKIKGIIEQAETSGKKSIQEKLGISPESGGDGKKGPVANPFLIKDAKQRIKAMTDLFRNNRDLYEKYKREAKAKT